MIILRLDEVLGSDERVSERKTVEELVEEVLVGQESLREMVRVLSGKYPSYGFERSFLHLGEIQWR